MLSGKLLWSVSLLLFAVAATSSGLDRLSRHSPGLQRLVVIPFRAQADRSATALAIGHGDLFDALRYAHASVSSDPVDPDSTPALGSALLAARDAQTAQEAFRVAARFGWRNPETQVYWFNAAVAWGDYEIAAQRADALMRAHPELAEEPTLLSPLESTPPGREQLARRLQLQPPWLTNYLKIGGDVPGEVIDRRYLVLTAADAMRTHFGCDAASTFVRSLLANGRRREAEVFWNAECPAKKVTEGIADPTFSHVNGIDADASPFSWRAVPSGDVRIETSPLSKDERELTVTNSRSVAVLALYQAVNLAPGLYRVRLEGTGGTRDLDRLVRVSWSCDGPIVYPGTSKGAEIRSGQYLVVMVCDRQRVGIWIAPHTSTHLRSISLHRID